MSKALMMVGFAVIAVATFAIGACEVKTQHYNAAFSRVAIGDTAAAVIAKMGPPAVQEHAGQPYLRYATSGCTNPCAIRLWWELPIMPGVEGWSVELDRGARVVHTAHWVSP
jgi:hypothetical protein